MRKTSIDAYNSIKINGHLSTLRWSVYDFIFTNGPCTAKHVHLALRTAGQNDGCYTTRMSELREAGLLFEVGTVKCEFTGRTVTQWDVTDKMLPEKKTKMEKLEMEKARLIARLRKVIANITELEE